MSMQRRTLLCAAVLSALLAGCREEARSTPDATPPVAAAASMQVGALESAVDTFIEGVFQRMPTFAANAGRHEFDGKLPDYSPAALEALGTWLHAQRDTFAGFGDGLDPQHRFQRDYVLAVIDGQLFWLEESGFPYSNPAYYLGDLSPSMYLTRPYAPLPQRMAAFVASQDALPAAIAQIKA